ncbi:MAG: (Fe-S)-binding protein, partial [Bacteroidales bacterium]
MELSDKQKKSLDVLKNRLDGRLLSYLNSCVHCGLCAESCHYYLSDNNERNIPGKKADQLSSIYRRYYTLAGRLIPRFIGAKDYNEKTIEDLTDLAFGACTMCGRCTIHCSIGVDISLLVRTARSMLVVMDKVPKGLQ